jgi:hypothetical protein
MIFATLVTILVVGIVFAYLRKPRHINERFQGEHAVVIGGSMGSILAASLVTSNGHYSVRLGTNRSKKSHFFVTRGAKE